MADTNFDTDFRTQTARQGSASRFDTSSSGGSEPQQHSEGPVARTIENQTARIPSDIYLWASLASMGVSLFLQLRNHKERSLFIGQWAPSFLILGLYNKMVKQQGSDRVHW